MGNIFGKKGQSRITDQDKAVLGLKQQRDKLNQYKKRVELNLDKERQVAKTLLKQGNKDKARTLLKKKRYQESLLAKCDGQLDTIQQMIDNLEFAQIEIKVVENLKVGNENLKRLHSLMSVEDVERILDETRDGVEYQREIDDLLSGSLTAEDEEAVQAELDALTEAAEDVPLPSVPETELPEQQPELPEVPTNDPAKDDTERISKKNRQREAVLAS